MTPSLAEATAADIPQLCQLLAIQFSQEADFHPEPERQAAGLRRIIEHPEVGRILVLREGDTIVGMVNLLFTVSTFRGGRVILLEDMVVRPDRRGDGAGSRILQGAIDFARDQGCSRITLLTDHDNERAIRFYRRHGFAGSSMIPLRLTILQT